MLRNHEFCKDSAEERAKPQAAHRLQVSSNRRMLETSEKQVLAPGFFPREEARAMYICERGKIWPFFISSWCGISVLPIGKTCLR